MYLSTTLGRDQTKAYMPYDSIYTKLREERSNRQQEKAEQWLPWRQDGAGLTGNGWGWGTRDPLGVGNALQWSAAYTKVHTQSSNGTITKGAFYFMQTTLNKDHTHTYPVQCFFKEVSGG